LLLWKQNRSARPVKYSYTKHPEKSKWYSRSMGLLGTLILIFLVIHTSHFWIPNRVSQGISNWEHGEIDLYGKMLVIFQNPVVVIIYLLGCFSLFWHLLHGFQSAFQSLGLNHMKYNNAISFVGTAFSIVVPFIFALMPIAIYLKWIYYVSAHNINDSSQIKRYG
jgi:succinate dehydrogenase / fumarate reductase cytochrome b subunit